MNWQAVAFDWNQARAFLATAEAGSLSAAARVLGLTQPTVGRQIAALEASLEVALFERMGRSLRLTPSGLELLEHVRSMGEAAGLLSLAASGQSQSVEGQVCITATEMLSSFHLPGILARLAKVAPGIEIEVVVSNSIRDLRRREADIAIRHVRPDQPDLIARRVHETTGHFYASSEYLDRHGRPTGPEDLIDATVIVYESRDRVLSFLDKFGLPLGRRNLKYLTNSSVAGWEMMKQGLGLYMIPREIGDATEGVEAVLPDVVAAEIPVWLATHRELRTSGRIRLVFDFLAEALADPSGTRMTSIRV